MRKSFIMPLCAAVLVLGSCAESSDKQQTAGIDIKNMDTTVAPGKDFYRYACGGWMDANPIPDAYARYGSFDLLAENNSAQLKDLIVGLAHDGSADSTGLKVGKLYNIAMDSVKLNKDGFAPVRPYMERIDNVASQDGLSALAGVMMKEGFYPYFVLYAGADDMNSSMNIAHISQAGLTLGNRDYYIASDKHNKEIRKSYEDHVERMFTMYGMTEKEASKAAKSVLKVETALAKAHYDNITLRDPYANYHKVSMADLKKEVKNIDWDAFFGAMGYAMPDSLNVAQFEPLKKAASLMAKGNFNDQKNYLKWRVIASAAPYLSDEIVEADFDFNGRVLSGLKEMKPRWRRAVATVNEALGEAVGKMYVEKYFPAEAKERMTGIIDNLKESLGERIQALGWMSDSTKVKAMEKLETFYVKVGYPDTWKDYSALVIADDSYFANIVRANVFSYDEMYAKVGKPVDKTEWLMTPQTVNAYYNPTTNEICFPAAILQPPFFDMAADDAFNYGAIGVVIGHEMTHGFDDQGRSYDKDGNLSDWWSEQDAENFKERAQVLVDWFNAIEVLPGLYANGQFTLGENIADHGGIQVAYQAFKNATAENPLGDKEGFTPEQRFFIAYANLWAGNIRDEQIRLLTQIDVHSLGRLRVNAALPHISAWYDAFGITEDDEMYLAPEKRVSIW